MDRKSLSRRGLSKDILKTAESYLEKGDLWEFLREIDSKLHRLNREIVDIEAREDSMAATYIEKVLSKRQDQVSITVTFTKSVKK